jgi:type IX secretion system PorP/SprF family membrane protein
MVRLLLLLFGLILVEFALAQDIHFSHLNRQPTFQNPGNAGLFVGDLRLNANYKDQWRSVTIPFTTIAVSSDFRWKPKAMGFGFVFFHDKVGDGTFQTVEGMFSAAKHLKLTSDSSHLISTGLQIGFNYRQVNLNSFYVDLQFDGVAFNPGLATQEAFNNDSKWNVNTGAGATYQWLIDKAEKLTAGISLHNINRPNQGFYGQVNKRDRRLSLFAQYQRPLNQDLTLLPGLGLNFQGTYREILVGSQLRYTLVQKLGTYRAVDGGIWFRARDAVIVRLGASIQNWSVAVSYDTNISQLVPASRLRGGLELSAEYILTRFKPRNIYHRVCPDYI